MEAKGGTAVESTHDLFFEKANGTRDYRKKRKRYTASRRSSGV